MKHHFRNSQKNNQFQENGRGKFRWKLRRKESKKLKILQKLLEQMSQIPQYNQSRQSQSSPSRINLFRLARSVHVDELDPSVEEMYSDEPDPCI